MSNNPAETENNNPANKPKSLFREYAEAIIIALFLAIFIRTFIIQAFKIPSGSMKNTLLIGDHILVTKFSYGTHVPNEIPFTRIKLFDEIVFFQGTPQRYDVIVFKYPLDEGKDFIKRVIGLPGETIAVREQVVYINERKIEDPYARHTIPIDDEPVFPRDEFGPVLIPEGHVFVMGDNRENSQDSRYWGFLDVSKIRGKAKMIYWSWNSDDDTCGFCGGWARWDRMGQSIE